VIASYTSAPAAMRANCGRATQHLPAGEEVRAHQPPLRVREPAGLLEHLAGHAQLVDVVQHQADAQRGQPPLDGVEPAPAVRVYPAVAADDALADQQPEQRHRQRVLERVRVCARQVGEASSASPLATMSAVMRAATSRRPATVTGSSVPPCRSASDAWSNVRLMTSCARARVRSRNTSDGLDAGAELVVHPDGGHALLPELADVAGGRGDAGARQRGTGGTGGAPVPVVGGVRVD
jgi:hypothetical protein